MHGHVSLSKRRKHVQSGTANAVQEYRISGVSSSVAKAARENPGNPPNPKPQLRCRQLAANDPLYAVVPHEPTQARPSASTQGDGLTEGLAFVWTLGGL